MKSDGLRESPITPERLASAIRITDVAWDGDGRTVVWREERSDLGVLVLAGPDGVARDLTAGPSVRARVGYGGGDFSVAAGVAYFVADGRLWRKPLQTGVARPITPAFGQSASPAVSPDGRWVAFVHAYEGRDVLAVADAWGNAWPQVLVFGADFYMQPCWHPDGRRIAFVAWNHPHMPWDGTRLQLAELSPQPWGPPRAEHIRTVAGGEEEAVQQPGFSPDGRHLAFVSDRGGWANLHIYDLEAGALVAAVEDEAEHAPPAWRQGMRSFAWSADGRRLYYVRNDQGFQALWCYDLQDRAARPVDVGPYTAIAQLAASPAGPPSADRLAFIGSSPSVPPRLVVLEVDPSSGRAREVRVLRYSAVEDLEPQAYSAPEPVSWRAPDGTRVFGLYYRPPDSAGGPLGAPSAVIRVHGGPTSQATAAFSPEVQFLTTRGYAVLEVNYRGSSGYGRAYLQALRGRWGVVDAEDAVGGARHLVEQGLADPGRLAILGGSAGGYTVLRALTLYPGFFKAAVCLFGVSNLFTLAAETHKFEQRYLDSLVGPLPQAAAIYRERSPVFSADRIRDPIAIFQGDEDRVVPKSQSDAIVDSLRRRGVPHEYHVYPGEGHGWRRRETIEAYYRALEAFLRRHLVWS